MKKQLTPILAALVALPTAAFAQVVVVDFGESTTYVTANQNLAGGNGGYNATNISPASGYTGPTFTGGVTFSIGGGAATWQLADNYVNAGGFDAIRFSSSGLANGVSATFVGMFAGSQTFSIDNTANSSFFLKGRRDGGHTGAGITGVRWLLQDTIGNYYVSALNDSTNAQFGNTYALNPGVAGSSLVGLDWFNYTFSSGAIGSAISDEVAFFGSTQFNAAGFNYTAARITSGGSIDMQFADFSLTAVPEPTTAAFLGMGLAGLMLARRRRRD